MKILALAKSKVAVVGIVGVVLSIGVVASNQKGQQGKPQVRSIANNVKIQVQTQVLPKEKSKTQKTLIQTPNANRNNQSQSKNNSKSQGPGRSGDSSSDLSNELAIFYGIWNSGDIDSVTALDGTEVYVTAETYVGFMDLPWVDRRVALYQDSVAGWESSRQIYALTLQGNLYYVSGEPTRLNEIGNIEGGVRWIKKVDPQTGDVLATDYAPSGVRYWYGGGNQLDGDVVNYFDGGYTIIGDKIYYYSSSGNVVCRQFGASASSATRVATGFHGVLFSLGNRLLTRQIWSSYTYRGEEAGTLSVGLYQIPTGSALWDPTSGGVERVLDGVPLFHDPSGATIPATVFPGDRGMYWWDVTRWSGDNASEVEVYCLEPANRWSGIAGWNSYLVARMGFTSSYGTNRLPSLVDGILIDEAGDNVYVTALTVNASSGDAHVETIFEYRREESPSISTSIAFIPPQVEFSFSNWVPDGNDIDFTISVSHGIQFLTLR